jgi:2'-5' RNA ligase
MLAGVTEPAKDASIRLFVAVVPPEHAVAHLTAALPDRAAVRDGRARWTHSADWHLTLAFLGWVRPDGVAAVERAVAAGVADAPDAAPELAFGGAGHFGRRVLWIGVTGDVAGLSRLSIAVRASLARDGITFDPKPLHPHLTLARGDGLRVPTDLRTYAGPSWAAGEVLLMRSTPGRAAPRYAAVAHWPVVAG